MKNPDIYEYCLKDCMQLKPACRALQEDVHTTLLRNHHPKKIGTFHPVINSCSEKPNWHFVFAQRGMKGNMRTIQL